MMGHEDFRRQAHEHRVRRIGEIKRAHGGAADSDEKSDARMVRHAMAEHDSQLHPGHHTKLKLKDGGAAEGECAPRRSDRPGRRRRDDGGATDASTTAMSRAVSAGLAQNLNPPNQQRARGGKTGGGKRAGHVNVIVATGGRDRTVPVPIPAGGPPMAPRPPIAPPGAMGPGGPMLPPGVSGGMPPGLAARPPMMAPGAGPGMPPTLPIRADGGKIGSMTAGAQSALGRIQKAKMKIPSENAIPD